MRFAIGEEVIEKTGIRAHTSYNINKVVGFLDGSVLVMHYGFGFDGETHGEDYDSKPGSRSWRSGIQRFQEDELYTVPEALEELHRLEAAKSKLEEEFDAVTSQVQEKLEAAAKLAGEATAILVKHNKDYEDVLEAGAPLYKALRDGGWRHSTFRCKYGDR